MTYVQPNSTIHIMFHWRSSILWMHFSCILWPHVNVSKPQFSSESQGDFYFTIRSHNIAYNKLYRSYTNSIAWVQLAYRELMTYPNVLSVPHSLVVCVHHFVKYRAIFFWHSHVVIRFRKINDPYWNTVGCVGLLAEYLIMRFVHVATDHTLSQYMRLTLQCSVLLL